MNNSLFLKNCLAVFLLVICSCNRHDANQEPPAVKTEHIVFKGHRVKPDSVEKPIVSTVGIPSVITSFRSKIITVNDNTEPAGSAKILEAGKPRVATPGNDTFSLPQVVPAVDSIYPIIQPKATAALPMRMKDASLYDVQYLDVDQGMNSSYVRAILQDKNGNLWLGTDVGGANKYDGKSFTHYALREGLPDNTINKIFEDREGNLWYGAPRGGIAKYNGTTITRFTERQGLINNNVKDILQDRRGNIWIATEAGVDKYDGKKFTHFTSKQGLGADEVRAIVEDKTGTLWFATYGGGISSFNGKAFTTYTEKEGLANNYLRALAIDNGGNLWMGTDGAGVSVFDGETFTNSGAKQGLKSDFVRCILKDSDGNLWIGTDGEGVSCYNVIDKTFTNFNEQNGLSNKSVWAIYEDREENLWFGTEGGGVCRYNRRSFKHYTDQRVIGNNVLSIFEDKQHNLWFGTRNAGVSKYDGRSFTQYTPNNDLDVSSTILTTYEDRSGNIWFGSYGGGVIKYDGHSFFNFPKEKELSETSVRAIFEDKDGNMWFGTDEIGVLKYDGKLFTRFTDKQGLCGKSIRAIIQDQSGNLWFGSARNGISIYNGVSFTNYSQANGLLSDQVRSIIQDAFGNTWIATNRGIDKYDGTSMSRFTEKEGLSNNTVWGLLEDHQGRIWASTENGLNCLIPKNKRQKNTDYKILSFHKEDGLKSEDFFQNAIYLDSKNRLWLGSGKALTMLNLNKFMLIYREPAIQLETIFLQENFVDFQNVKTNIQKDSSIADEFKGNRFNEIVPFYNYPVEMELPYDLNHLTFNFSSSDIYAPHKIVYQYRLADLDKTWSELSSDNKADYRNIPEGNYTFQVRAKGISQHWSKTFNYAFKVRPPWWKTWWAYTLLFFILILLVVFIVWFNIRRLRARAKDLKIKVEEATVEIKKQKKLIEEKHKETTDSINYAERIQRSLLASETLLDNNLKDYFVFFKPKDIVSGDFYWAVKPGQHLPFVLVTADSTGHGVPGAIMSILNISCLNETIKEGYTQPAEILDKTRIKIIDILKKDGSIEGGKDGMDCSLIAFDFKNLSLTYAAANNPVWIVRHAKIQGEDRELIDLRPDKMPVGKHDRDSVSFTQHTVLLQKGDVVYTLTDGMPDQFGGEKGKKFMHKQLKAILVSIAHLSMLQQHEFLNRSFKHWKGDLEQVDDVCVIGVKI